MPLQNTHYTYEEIDKIFEKSKKIFFIGIGGVSMSALSAYCRFLGKEIYGYDANRTNECIKQEKHAVIKYYSTPDSVKCMDLVIYSNAIENTNFEYVNAEKLKIPTLSRANFLGYIIWKHKKSICISGTHGKSTTTAYLAKIFDYAGKKPTVFCGALMKDYLSSWIFGEKELAICEACEYMDSFLEFKPSIACILNIEYDHPDYFKNEDELINSFSRFINNSGQIVANIDCPNVKKLLDSQNHTQVTTFSLKSRDADYFGEVKSNSLICYQGDKMVFETSLKARGTHFIYDAMCAASCALCNGASASDVACALSDTLGVSRRLEFITKTDTGADVFEDYAHHPTEIKATLSAVKEMGYKNICCIFQPHTYSRTKYVFNNTESIFSDANTTYIIPTFPSREKTDIAADSQVFANKFGVIYEPSLLELCHKLKSSHFDCIIFMGAGDITCFKKYFQFFTFVILYVIISTIGFISFNIIFSATV